MRKRIGLNLDGVISVGSAQTNSTSAHGPYHTSKQCPTLMWWVELGSCFRGAVRNFHLASLQIGSIKIRIALPEERCLTSIVARSKRFLIFPNTANSSMVLKVLSYTWKMLYNWD